MPELSTDTHRGKVCSALSTVEWMDAHEVAADLSWSRDSASTMLSDVHRAGYVHRRDIDDNRANGADYEYQLKENIRFK